MKVNTHSHTMPEYLKSPPLTSQGTGQQLIEAVRSDAEVPPPQFCESDVE